MRALFLVFMVMASALSIKAAAVQWGRIYLNENGNLECAFPISSFSIYCEFASASNGSSAWSFTPYGADLEFVGTVYEAKAGAHVNDRTVQRADSVFACRAEDGSIPKSWTPLNGNGPETRYLAFYFSSDYGEIFGWLELEVTGSAIFSRSSAFATGGFEPPVVGSIPEPSGGVLLLLGTTVLVLRRRRFPVEDSA